LLLHPLRLLLLVLLLLLYLLMCQLRLWLVLGPCLPFCVAQQRLTEVELLN
jgi:hypothetical protein